MKASNGLKVMSKERLSTFNSLLGIRSNFVHIAYCSFHLISLESTNG
jgi:hypothetical protein